MITRNEQLPLPPSLAQRITAQLGTFPPGQGRTAADIAGQMVGMDPVSLLGYLKTMASQHLVLSSDCPPDKHSKWRLG
jgi:hypothetical protein